MLRKAAVVALYVAAIMCVLVANVMSGTVEPVEISCPSKLMGVDKPAIVYLPSSYGLNVICWNKRYVTVPEPPVPHCSIAHGHSTSVLRA